MIIISLIIGQCGSSLLSPVAVWWRRSFCDRVFRRARAILCDASAHLSVIFRRSIVNLAKISVETGRCRFVCHAQQHVPKCDRKEIASSVETVFQSLEDSPDLRKQVLAISKTA